MSGSPPSVALTSGNHPEAGTNPGPEARLAFSGDWTVARLGVLERELAALAAPSAPQVVFDLSGVSGFDSAGAWLAVRLRNEWTAAGKEVRLLTASPEHDLLLIRVAHASPEPPPEPPGERPAEGCSYGLPEPQPQPCAEPQPQPGS